MTDRWSYPVAQAMQRHTGSRYVKPKAAPPTVPDEPPAVTPDLAPLAPLPGMTPAGREAAPGK
jgi:hypothetical protein